ncbi:MAG: malto-oligosyltrehalose trehalohydrolase [Desulfobacteraceae bacterium]|nr:MAG: malto-oligosyltrehalose trehalohydrolase [Desulfobacteraceae bacterium]
MKKTTSTQKRRNWSRRLPIGAEVLPGGGVHFRVWAPRRRKVFVALDDGSAETSKKGQTTLEELASESDGYFSGAVTQAAEGFLYRFRFDEENDLYPDPASRFQPDGPEGPSQVVDPSRFPWTDEGWSGAGMKGQIVYEMHIGTFTREGTWQSALEHLPELAELGVTLLEIMPVADFAGRFGWGYDGVNLYAPTRLYGSPDDFRLFVDCAHALGLGVILDVVYNHLGPVGNYLPQFSIDYFTDRYETEWGYAINFDGDNSESVREFVISNAVYWVSEFHLDGLRIDATQSIFDRSSSHILSDLIDQARRSAAPRSLVFIGENEPQQARLIRSPEEGGFGLNALWNDDFHHTAMVALTGRNEGYYSNHLGSPQELISAAKWGFLYQGQYYHWQNKARGSRTFGFEPFVFVNFVQNHDQIANSARGERIHKLTDSGRLRAMTALLLLLPQTPMLFQGQEFCSSNPFCYFADCKEDLAEKVRTGRLDFLSQFESLRGSIREAMADPCDPETFRMCKLDRSKQPKSSACGLLHRDLLRLRREDEVFREQRADWVHGAVVGPEAFVLRFLGEGKGDRLIVVNLGRSLNLLPAPEPLLAPPLDSRWDVLWSSEDARYGGGGTPEMNTEGTWYVPGHTAIVLAPMKIVRLL